MYLSKSGNSQVMHKSWKSTHEALRDQIQYLTVKLKGLKYSRLVKDQKITKCFLIDVLHFSHSV